MPNVLLLKEVVMADDPSIDQVWARDRLESQAVRARLRTREQTAAMLASATFALIGLVELVQELAGSGPPISQHAAAIYLIFGLAGATATRSHRPSRRYLVGGGMSYLGLFALSWWIDPTVTATYLPIDPGNWLHFILAATMIITGLVTAIRKVSGEDINHA